MKTELTRLFVMSAQSDRSIERVWQFLSTVNECGDKKEGDQVLGSPWERALPHPADDKSPNPLSL